MRYGRYQQADSLLRIYKDQSSSSHVHVGKQSLSIRRYYQLLNLESKFLNGNSSIDDLLLADSLENYYDGVSQEKHAKTLAILGDIYFVSYDYPSALEYLLKAEEEAEEAGELWLQGIICGQEGDIYRNQQMYKEMTDCYIRNNNISTYIKDTLRMAHAAFSMGKVYTFLNNPDSTIYFYKKAIELGSNIEQAENIVPYANYELADIYLQLEEFDKAADIMPRDSMNDVNWGYWHFQQDHKDSASYYFDKSYKRYGHQGQASLLKILAQIELEKRDLRQSIDYLKLCVENQDSVIEQTQVEATQKVEAQYNLNTIRKALNKSERQKTIAFSVGLISLLTLLAALVMFALGWAYIRKKREENLIFEKLLRIQMEQKKKISKEQLEENNRKIQQLEEELTEARRKSNEAIIQKLRLNSERLIAENEQIRASRDLQQRLEKEWKLSDLYKTIVQKAGIPGFILSEEEWKEIEQNMDVVYDNFTDRLQELTKLSEIERHLCCLIKMEIRPSAIAEILCRQKGSITMARKRLGKKILRKDCSAEDFDAFIRNF